MINGNDLFVNITTATARTPDEAVMETHVKMVDIQIPLDVEETYGYTPACRLPDIPYNEEKDITKYPGVAADCYVTCQPGMFAIFFPQDGHAPCISSAPAIKKAIFKILAANILTPVKKMADAVLKPIIDTINSALPDNIKEMVDVEEMKEKLAAINYVYQEERNQFI